MKVLPKFLRLNARHQKWRFTFIGGTSVTSGILTEKNLSRGEFIRFPLATAQVGDHLIVRKIKSDRQTARYLSNLGLKQGTEIKVVSQTASGSVIVCIQRDQIGLGAEIASQVLVTMVEQEK